MCSRFKSAWKDARWWAIRKRFTSLQSSTIIIINFRLKRALYQHHPVPRKKKNTLTMRERDLPLCVCTFLRPREREREGRKNCPPCWVKQLHYVPLHNTFPKPTWTTPTTGSTVTENIILLYCNTLFTVSNGSCSFKCDAVRFRATRSSQPSAVGSSSHQGASVTLTSSSRSYWSYITLDGPAFGRYSRSMGN